MAVNLSIKAVPDTLAAELRARAARNHRSLQRELMAILERAVDELPVSVADSGLAPQRLRIEELAEHARLQFPNGTPSSVDIIREQRDGRFGSGSHDASAHSTTSR